VSVRFTARGGYEYIRIAEVLLHGQTRPIASFIPFYLFFFLSSLHTLLDAY
jgi:hypothetical protein